MVNNQITKFYDNGFMNVNGVRYSVYHANGIYSFIKTLADNISKDDDGTEMGKLWYDLMQFFADPKQSKIPFIDESSKFWNKNIDKDGDFWNKNIAFCISDFLFDNEKKIAKSLLLLQKEIDETYVIPISTETPAYFDAKNFKFENGCIIINEVLFNIRRAENIISLCQYCLEYNKIASAEDLADLFAAGKSNKFPNIVIPMYVNKRDERIDSQITKICANFDNEDMKISLQPLINEVYYLTSIPREIIESVSFTKPSLATNVHLWYNNVTYDVQLAWEVRDFCRAMMNKCPDNADMKSALIQMFSTDTPVCPFNIKILFEKPGYNKVIAQLIEKICTLDKFPSEFMDALQIQIASTYS